MFIDHALQDQMSLDLLQHIFTYSSVFLKFFQLCF
jgi:hypothetical protein